MQKDDLLTLFSYLIAAAIIIPLGWWLHQYDGAVGNWILSWFQ